MLAVKRRNATGWFSWIGSDGWGGRGLAYEGKEAQVNVTIGLTSFCLFCGLTAPVNLFLVMSGKISSCVPNTGMVPVDSLE